ncbi:MAG: hypothetical protein IT374_16395 [Polyangiaceae bacterium]|nr:hypothetical protein [Polyangiaceae bacterium]
MHEERRRHVVYTTAWLEYHVRGGVCVAVRERGASEFLRGHLAIGAPIVGAIRLGAPTERVPGVGDSLCLGGARALVTPRVRGVSRPSRETTLRY